MAAHHLNFTERALDTWVRATLTGWSDHPDSIPATGEAWAQDRGGSRSVPGLHLRLRLRSDGGQWTLNEPTAAFYLMKKVNGSKVNRLLGDRRVVGVDTAREQAKALLGKLTKGEDPKVEQRKAEEAKTVRALTYRKALEEFLEDSPGLTEGTRKKYRLSLTTTFKELADKPLLKLTPRKVRTIHEERSKESRSRADQDARVLRAVWYWVLRNRRGAVEVLGPNPVTAALNKKQSGRMGWNRVPRKESIIPKARLPEWFTALHQQRDAQRTSRTRRVSALLLEALILSGLRFNELARLDWSQVNLPMGMITIPDSTSKNRRALIRPITRRLGEILRELGPAESGYIFPGRHKGKALNDTRPLQVEIQDQTGMWVIPHDLRRVWTSAAVRADVPPMIIKRLLNHLTNVEEVTEGYARFGLDELLTYAQRVEDQILTDAGLLTPASDDDRLAALLAGLSEAERQRLGELIHG